MKPVAIFLAVMAMIVGIYMSLHGAHRTRDAYRHAEESVMIERARGHVSTADSEALLTGINLVRERDSGQARGGSEGASGAQKVSCFLDPTGGRLLLIDGPEPTTVVAGGPCIVTRLYRWLGKPVTLAHCPQAGFASTVELGAPEGKTIVALTPSAR